MSREFYSWIPEIPINSIIHPFFDENMFLIFLEERLLTVLYTILSWSFHDFGNYTIV